ncbi:MULTISPECIES: hypothetical protein [Brevibacterium]|uniref:hypothetical protein n=1 Tax=Brevibacterium TaxID=1696 RepID=UPI0031CFE495
MSNPAAQRTQNSANFADVVVFVVCFALFIFSIYLFGAAFSSPAGTEFWVFWAGLVVASIAFMLPMIYHAIVDRRS